MRSLMDFIPSLDRPVSVKVVADQVGLSEKETHEYLQRWAAQGLIDPLYEDWVSPGSSVPHQYILSMQQKK